MSRHRNVRNLDLDDVLDDGYDDDDYAEDQPMTAEEEGNTTEHNAQEALECNARNPKVVLK
ncbi:hypothetical protein EC991_008041 [Linnemannia zychae]|nr:hypothetical protein EC991_008041 [Linnemannia zychae]